MTPAERLRGQIAAIRQDPNREYLLPWTALAGHVEAVLDLCDDDDELYDGMYEPTVPTLTTTQVRAALLDGAS